MQRLSIFLGLIILISVDAHTLMTNVTIAGKTTDTCLRPAYPGSLWSQTQIGASDPIMQETTDGKWRGGVASTNYTCGFMPFAGQAAPSKCSVAAGSLVTVSYYHGAGYTGETPAFDEWIARSHKGPFMAFMAKFDAKDGLPQGNAWFKIFQLGKIKEATNNDWQTVQYASPDGLNNNHGGMNFTIPRDLAPGNYLLRTEIIALHSAGALYGAQPYVRCVELTVTGAGSASPAGVAIPGNWNASHPGMNYKLWQDYTKPYPFPGPDVYVAGSLATTSPSTSTTAKPSASSTAKPSSAPSTASMNSGSNSDETLEVASSGMTIAISVFAAMMLLVF